MRKLKKCKMCERSVLTPKAQFCDSCSLERVRAQRKAATRKFREANGLLKPKETRICSKCHLPKTEFYKGHAQCKECYIDSQNFKKPKAMTVITADNLPGGELYWKLIERASNNPTIKQRRIREQTAAGVEKISESRKLIGEL